MKDFLLSWNPKGSGGRQDLRRTVRRKDFRQGPQLIWGTRTAETGPELAKPVLRPSGRGDPKRSVRDLAAVRQELAQKPSLLMPTHMGEILQRDASKPVAALKSMSATKRPSLPYG